MISRMRGALRVRLLASAIVVGLGLTLASQAAADRGPRNDVRVQAACTGSSRAELRVHAEDGRLRIEFRLDPAGPYGAWTVVVLRERRIVFRGTVRAGGRGRAVDVRRTVEDWPGTNAIVVRASTRSGQSCQATATV